MPVAVVARSSLEMHDLLLCRFLICMPSGMRCPSRIPRRSSRGSFGAFEVTEGKSLGDMHDHVVERPRYLYITVTGVADRTIDEAIEKTNGRFPSDHDDVHGNIVEWLKQYRADASLKAHDED